MGDRSRSPRPAAARRPDGSTAAEDVALGHRTREAYVGPAQSKFRVAAVVRFRRTDGSEGTFVAVNAEPHDANIRGAICAERAALCRFQREEEAAGSIVVRVVCVTDAAEPIFPGPLCREFLTSLCAPGAEIVASGTQATASWVAKPLCELFVLPSVYHRLDKPMMQAFGAKLAQKVRPPENKVFAEAYEVAFARARKQYKAQEAVFPILFAAAARLADGRVHCAHELKGIEYGCSVDAVTLLLPELLRAKEEGDGGDGPAHVVQVDQFGVAHAPFAAARSLLVEHGLGETLLCAHDKDGRWAAPITAEGSLPAASFMVML